MSLPQPPEGILDPKQPWYPAKVGEKTWVILKAKLTGGEAFGTGYSSTVNLTSADADKLIENLKKDPRGYPQMDNGGGGRDFYDNLTAYQEWLREDYLEKPFNKERDAKIEEAAVESRMKEIQSSRRTAALENISKTLKPNVVGKFSTVKGDSNNNSSSTQQIADKPIVDQTFLKKNVEPILEKIDSTDGDAQTITEIIENKKIDKDPDIIDKVKPKEKDYGTLINSGMFGLQADVKKVSGSVDALVKINESILNSSEKIVKCLSDIKSILLQQTSLTKQQVEDQKSTSEEASMDATKVSSGTQDYVKTYDDTPGNDEAAGSSGGGKGFLGKAIDAVDFADDIFDVSKHVGGKKRKGLKGNRAYSKFRRSKAGRFLGGKFNLPRGIRSRTKKLSAGGFLNSNSQKVMVGEAGKELVTPPKLAGGGLQAGIYDNPTRGNLLPGQAVIPFNRNSGKNLINAGGTKKEGVGFGMSQPLATAMTIPFKAIGGGLFGIAASFLPLLGPFGGLLRPFLSLIVRPLGKILGAPTQMLDAVLGSVDSPIFSFDKILSSIGKTFGIDKDDKTPSAKTDDADSSRSTTPGKAIQGGNADFWSLAAVSSLEGVNSQGEADVAQAVYNRVASGAFSVNTIKDAVLSPGQFQPVTGDNVDINLWKAVKDRETAIAAVAAHKGKGTATAAQYVDEGAANITNKSLQKDAAEWVGGRTDFATPNAANKYPGGFGYKTRHGHLFGWYVGPGAIAYGKKNPGPAGVPNFPIKAEKGTNTSEDDTNSSYMIKGPNSGFPIKITTRNGETTDVLAHGKESVHVGQSGFTILPHENNKFSVSKNPFETFERWNTLVTSTPSDKGKKQSAASGIVVKDRPWNSGIPLENLKTKSGGNYKVAKSLAPKFKGFVGDLEATGYKIKSIGGWREAGSGGGSGPPDPDYDKGRYHHPYGASIDINPNQNPYRPDGKLITDFPSNINTIAKKWGLGWGGNWSSSKDTMHFSAGKSEGGSGYDMKTGGELWQGNPINPGASNSETATSNTTESGESTQQSPADPMEALKQSATQAFTAVQQLQSLSSGKKWDEVKDMGKDATFDSIFKPGSTTPTATSNTANAVVSGAALNAASSSRPQIAPVSLPPARNVPTILRSRETIQQTRQKELLARL